MSDATVGPTPATARRPSATVSETGLEVRRGAEGRGVVSDTTLSGKLSSTRIRASSPTASSRAWISPDVVVLGGDDPTTAMFTNVGCVYFENETMAQEDSFVDKLLFNRRMSQEASMGKRPLSGLLHLSHEVVHCEF